MQAGIALESLTENSGVIWLGLGLAATFLIIRRWIKFPADAILTDEHAQEAKQPGLLRALVAVLLSDIVFTLAFLTAGLTTALIYRSAVSLWGLGKAWPSNQKGSFGWFSYRLGVLAGLIAIIIERNEAWLHIWGLLVFTVEYMHVGRKTAQKKAKDEDSGTLGFIAVGAVLLLTYAMLLALSELLWMVGGLDYWIWFYIAKTLLTGLSMIFAILVFLPFLRLLLRAVSEISSSIR